MNFLRVVVWSREHLSVLVSLAMVALFSLGISVLQVWGWFQFLFTQLACTKLWHINCLSPSVMKMLYLLFFWFYLTDSSGFILPYWKTFGTYFCNRSQEPETCVSILRSTIYACSEDGMDNYKTSISHSVATQKLPASLGGFSPCIGDQVQRYQLVFAKVVILWC